MTEEIYNERSVPFSIKVAAAILLLFIFGTIVVAIIGSI